MDGVVQLVIRKRPELDTVNPPGQIRNDITLGDYVARKQEFMREEAKKLSFEEWFNTLKPEFYQKYHRFNGDDFYVDWKCWFLEVWETAQRNK